MSKSDYAENKVVDLLNGKAAFVTPAVFVALFTTAPTDAATGTEVTGGAYARKATVPADWGAAAAGSASNAAVITFAAASASWGTVTHFATYDALTAGNMLRWAVLTTAKAVGTGDTVSFAPGSLVTSED